MDDKDSVKSMASCLRSPKIKTVVMALEMLSAVCFIPGGHDRIMEGQLSLWILLLIFGFCFCVISLNLASPYFSGSSLSIVPPSPSHEFFGNSNAFQAAIWVDRWISLLGGCELLKPDCLEGPHFTLLFLSQNFGPN